MKICQLYLPVVRTLGVTRIINFNQADIDHMLPCLLLSLWELILIGQLFFTQKLFGATQHIAGKLGVKWAIPDSYDLPK